MNPFDPNRYRPTGALDDLVGRLRRIQTETLVGVDGRMAAGKSTLARWLSAQLDWPCYSLDDSLKGDGSWHDRDAVTEALNQLGVRQRPIIVEGARLLMTVDRQRLGFLIFVEDAPWFAPNGKTQKEVEQYLKDVRPNEIADFRLTFT